MQAYVEYYSTRRKPQMRTRIAVIPARGGSKRIKHKNIRDFCGKPILEYVVTAAKLSSLFETIHLSTDDQEIAYIGDLLNINTSFRRPENLSNDTIGLMPVMNFVKESFKSIGNLFDEYWLLMPTAAMLLPEDLIKAADTMAYHRFEKMAMAVREYDAPIEWAYEMKSDGSLSPKQPGAFSIRSQDIEPNYFDAGMFCAFPAQHIGCGQGSDLHSVGIKIDKQRAIDIDNEEDWRMAEALFRGLQSQEVLGC